MTAQNGKKPRLVYEYRNEEHEIPQRYIYQIHQSKGGGFDISESFFTWAFNKHEISIVDIQVLYSNPDRTPKGNKDTVAASSTFYIATVKGRDKKNMEKVGDGESGNESITNFQRGYPAGLAIKRAKVNMGKEFFNLVDLKLAIDCRDIVVPNGKDKGKTLEELAQTPQGQNNIRWFAGPDFNAGPEETFKYKAQQFCERYLGGSPMPPQKPLESAYREPTPIPTQTPVPTQNTTGTSVGTQTGQVVSTPQNLPTQGSTIGGANNTGATYAAPPTGTGGTQPMPQQQSQQPQQQTPPVGPPTQEQYAVIGGYSQKFQLTNEVILQLAQSVFGPQFNWQVATNQQTDHFIQHLKGTYGPL